MLRIVLRVRSAICATCAALISGCGTLHAQNFQSSYSITPLTAFYNHTNVVTTNDGGYIFPALTFETAIGEYALYVVKTFGNGNVDWTKKLVTGMPGSYINAYVIQTGDGGYAVVTTFEQSSSRAVLLAKLDAAANVTWERVFQGPLTRCGPVMQATDGGLLVTASYTDPTQQENFWMAKVDGSGAFLWSQHYDLGGGNDILMSAARTADGGVIMTGMTYSGADPSGDIGVIRTDANGNIQWGNRYAGYGMEEPLRVRELSSGSYAVVTRSDLINSGGYWDIGLMMLDSTGGVAWSYYYGGPAYDEGHDVVETADGNLVLACEPESFAGFSESCLLKTDMSGNVLWMKTYGERAGAFPAALVLAPDGGFAMTGTYGTFTQTSAPLFFLKTDANGSAECYADVTPVRTLYSHIVIPAGTALGAAPGMIVQNSWQDVMLDAQPLPCPEDSIFIPNVFTPNENGPNDFFMIQCSGVTSFFLQIYDRWGVLMFETNDPYQYWDGKARNGKDATEGTYYYVLVADGTTYKGFLTLLR